MDHDEGGVKKNSAFDQLAILSMHVQHDVLVDLLLRGKGCESGVQTDGRFIRSILDHILEDNLQIIMR